MFWEIDHKSKKMHSKKVNVTFTFQVNSWIKEKSTWGTDKIIVFGVYFDSVSKTVPLNKQHLDSPMITNHDPVKFWEDLRINWNSKLGGRGKLDFYFQKSKILNWVLKFGTQNWYHLHCCYFFPNFKKYSWFLATMLGNCWTTYW